MILMPDPNTAVIDPFLQHKTLILNCFVRDPVTGESYSRDPRYVAKKAEEYLQVDRHRRHRLLRARRPSSTSSTTCASCRTSARRSTRSTPSRARGTPARDEGPNLGYKPRYKEGYFPVPPMDHFQDLRSEMILTLERLGIEIEVQHHEVGTAGQAEIDMRFDTLLAMADKLMLYKYVVKNVARQHGLSATFMPKPIFQDNGSGMHVHQSLWKGDEPLFFDEVGYAGLSDMARWYIGGLLAHAPAILAFAAPTTNSYKRLVPGYEAPVNLVYSQRNRSAARAHPALLDEPEGQAARVPLSRPVVQPLPRLPGDADGRASTASSTRPSRPTPSTRTSTTCRRRSWRRCPRCPARSTSRSPPSRPTATSSRPAACSPTT